jgi:hypothetical protein
MARVGVVETDLSQENSRTIRKLGAILDERLVHGSEKH